MADAYTTAAEQYGITSTLTGYVIESENVTDTPQVENVPDQKNRVADEIQYDTRRDLRLTVRGATKPAATIIKFKPEGDSAENTWAVDSVEAAGTYNGLKRFNITAHRTTIYPGADATERTQAVTA